MRAEGKHLSDDEKRALHHQKMTQTPVPRLIGTLALPSVGSMLITSVYNMADTFFVSQLGTSAAGAVGIVFSLMAIIQALGFMLGIGGGNLVARLLGAKQNRQAEVVASTAFFTSLAVGTVILALGTAFRAQLVRMLGATETILPYAEDYARYILYAAPVMCASFVMNKLLQNQGQTLQAFIGIGLGGIVNVFLDPVFIFTFGLGTAGAAIATAISQAVSFCILLGIFLTGRSNVRFRLKSVARSPRVYLDIVKTGLPSFSRQGMASLASIALNTSAAVYGDAAVAAMGIVTRVFQFLGSAMIGLGQAMQSVAGFNYGARIYPRVRAALLFTMRLGLCVLVCLAVLGFAAAPGVMAIFRRDDAVVISLGTLAFRLHCVTLPTYAVSTTTDMGLQCTGHSAASTFLALCRQGVFFLPMVLTLPHWLGVLGVQAAQPLADVCSMLVCLVLLTGFLRKLKLLEAQQAAQGASS